MHMLFVYIHICLSICLSIYLSICSCRSCICVCQCDYILANDISGEVSCDKFRELFNLFFTEWSTVMNTMFYFILSFLIFSSDWIEYAHLQTWRWSSYPPVLKGAWVAENFIEWSHHSNHRQHNMVHLGKEHLNPVF